MRHHVQLATASLSAIVLMSIHHADDVVRGMAPGGLANVAVVLVLAAWAYATLVLVELRLGHAIILVASLLMSAIPVVHMTGSGLVGGTLAGSDGAFFFVWTLIALGISAALSVALSVRGLWMLGKE